MVQDVRIKCTSMKEEERRRRVGTVHQAPIINHRLGLIMHCALDKKKHIFFVITKYKGFVIIILSNLM